MDLIKYNDFKNICRICLLTCDNKCLPNTVISDIYCKLAGISFDLNIELPQQICEKCFAKLMEFDALALQCKQAHFILMNCLNKYKNAGIKEAQEIIDTNNDDFNENVGNEEMSDDVTNQNDFITVKNEYFGPDEIEINEHKVEFVNVENELQQLKQEFVEETIDEFNYDQNISVQDDFNENVVKQEMSDDDTNDLQDDTTSGSTSIKEVPNETFKNKIALNKHKRKHSVKRSFMCEICNKTFTHSSALSRHKRIHSGKRPYACEICNKTFNQSDHLTRHKRSHSGDHPYACEICSKAFTDSSLLNRHKRIHSGERPFKCEICNKVFRQSSTLNRHKRIHSGERPYACEICNKTFNDISHLHVHKRKHSGERPYACKTCNKTFNDSSNLNRHKLIHPDENDSDDSIK